MPSATSSRSRGRCSSWPPRSSSRAQEATLASRPYSEKLDEVLADLAAVLGAEDHPLLAEREGGKRLIILITTDRGLAGPLNTNTIRFAAREITQHEGDSRS